MKVLLAVVACLAVGPVRAEEDANKLAVELARSVMTEEQWNSYTRVAMEQAGHSMPEAARRMQRELPGLIKSMRQKHEKK